MSYSKQTIGRAISAALVAAFGAASAGAGGVDIVNLDLGQWLGVLGTALFTGGAVLHDPTGKVINQIHAKQRPVQVAPEVADFGEDLTERIIDLIRAGR